MKIIIVRHGESQGNIRKIVSSTLPGVDLSENGVEQVKLTGAEISSKYSFDNVYASPFMRTMHTAEILNSFIKKENIIPDLRIGEMFFGLYDGKGNEEMENEMQLFIRKVDQKDFSMRMGGIGDSEYSFRDRLYSFLIELGFRHINETVLVVTHQSPGGVMQEMVNNYTGHVSLKTAGWAEIELTEETLKRLIEERSMLFKNLRSKIEEI